MRQAFSVFSMLALGVLLGVGSAAAGDYWVSASEAGVATNNDCGQIVFIHGKPLIRRSFHTDSDAAGEAVIADRVNGGDELIAPPGSRLEMIAGSNTVMTLGEGARVRVDGLRLFPVAGVEVARLDATLLAGEIRIQVRQNVGKPEAALVAMDGAEILMTRGDAALFVYEGWRCATLEGEAAGRLRRGGVPGAPFPIPASIILSGSGSSPLEPEEKSAIMARVPFSFEIAVAALPPVPVPSAEPEAP